MPFINFDEPIVDLEIQKIDRYYDDGTPVYQTYTVRKSGTHLVYLTDPFAKRDAIRAYHASGVCEHPITKEYPGFTENQVICSVCGYISYHR
jgi:hypothetical protein